MPFEQFIPRPLTSVAVHAYAPTVSGSTEFRMHVSGSTLAKPTTYEAP
jgi:hypothetical protein